MAHVRMSSTLHDKIIANVERMFNVERNAAYSSLSPTFGDRVYDVVFPKPMRDIMEALPPGYLPTTKEVLFIGSTYQDTVKLSQKRLAPIHWFSTMSIGYNIESFCDKTDSPWVKSNFHVHNQFLIDEYAAYQTRIREVTKRTKETKDWVRHLLNKCQTVKQFLDAWPAGENVLPSDVLEKHSQKTKQRNLKADPPTLDEQIITQLNVTVLTKSLTGELHGT